MEKMELEEYLSKGATNIAKGIFRASLKNKKAAMFMMQYGNAGKKAREKRIAAEKQGEHIPPFLIASITKECNLHCKGCYARANHNCVDMCGQNDKKDFMTQQEWDNVFSQAETLGIEFILLAGGEPFVRKDILKVAGLHRNILFPVFTNGTMIENSHLEVLDKNRNLLPVVSIEGDRKTTDARRGEGVYDSLQEAMKEMNRLGIIFGASVTVTKQNMEEVLSDEFIESLKKSGVKAVVYVEYVPMDMAGRDLAPDDSDREKMMIRLNDIRKREEEMLFIAFPGDEKSSGGCLAAGRGFFHINANGGAEPCPFSPYSDTNVKEVGVRKALQSSLFRKLKESGNLTEEHIGGCVLFEQEEKVKSLLSI